MTIQLMFIGKKLTDDELKYAVGKAFDVEADDVLISHVFHLYGDPNHHKRIVCDVRLFKGDFPTSIEIYVQTEELLSKTTIETLLLIAENLNCDALIQDEESDSPYAHILLTSQKSFIRVSVDADQLDQQEPAYVIERYVT